MQKYAFLFKLQNLLRHVFILTLCCSNPLEDSGCNWLFSGCYKGVLTAADVFAVEWIHTGAVHFGMTVTYFGFISDGNALALCAGLQTSYMGACQSLSLTIKHDFFYRFVKTMGFGCADFCRC